MDKKELNKRISADLESGRGSGHRIKNKDVLVSDIKAWLDFGIIKDYELVEDSEDCIKYNIKFDQEHRLYAQFDRHFLNACNSMPIGDDYWQIMILNPED